jgi:hypothetical protein
MYGCWVTKSSNNYLHANLGVANPPPAATYLNFTHNIQITQSLKRLGIPFTVISTCAAREPNHNNGCGPLSRKRLDIPAVRPVHLTPLRRVLLAKLYVAQLVKRITTFYGTYRNHQSPSIVTVPLLKKARSNCAD